MANHIEIRINLLSICQFLGGEVKAITRIKRLNVFTGQVILKIRNNIFNNKQMFDFYIAQGFPLFFFLVAYP
jgi:hypothetical protein